MKKFLKSIVVIIVVLFVLMCLAQNLGILELSALESLNDNLSSYDGYYYNQLTNVQKQIYIQIDKSILKKETDVKLGRTSLENIEADVNKALSAYMYDKPEVYYLNNKYMLSTKDLKLFKYNMINISYLDVEDEAIITQGISTALKGITNNMTDFEKEKIIHDKLVSSISYYDFENIEDIPNRYHTIYGSLVENTAVCDGFAKAFKLLMNKVGIECIIVKGMLDDVPHAWNIVKIDGKYYHVDITLDSINVDGNKYIVHTFFNLNDTEIKQTHIVDVMFKIPVCNSNMDNYYIHEKFNINNKDNIDEYLKDIMSKQSTNSCIEFKVNDNIKSNEIIDSLYSLNFNNWKINMVSEVKYSKIRDIYIFIKK